MTVPDPRHEDLLSLIERQAGARADATFMTFGDGTTMSFTRLQQDVARFRGHLYHLGIEPGERVGLMLENSLFYPVAWLGVVTAGAVAVPMNKRLGESDARYLIEDSGAVALIVDESTEDVARRAASATVRTIFVAGGSDPLGDVDGVPAPAGLHAGSLANIQYTSGTTGFPKGCLLTHRYWQRMGAASVEIMKITADDTILTSQPFSYIDPQWNVIAALRAGAHLVLLDAFHPSTFMRDVARFGVTVFYCLGVMPTLLLKQPPAPHDREHSLSRVFCSAIPAQRHAEIEQRWGARWSEAFGMTETGINLAVAPEDHDRFVGAGCLGTALWHNEAIVVDEHDRELPPGEVGELVLRGLGFMESYHGSPEATAEFFRNGWAHTGDLVVKDADGYVYFRGRRKEMIRRGGENIAPAEIETCLSTHPEVLECAVVPVADEDIGEEIKAYVVTHPGVTISAESLAGYVGERLARFKVPRYWEFRATLPHTPSEKIAKHELEQDGADHLAAAIDVGRPRPSADAPKT
ncbi:MAG TPA: AMP-binding protein [Actinomycetota bacterium]